MAAYGDVNTSSSNNLPSLPPSLARRRFTVKTRWLQAGTFDTKFGEYEWMHKPKQMGDRVDRRKFHM